MKDLGLLLLYERSLHSKTAREPFDYIKERDTSTFQASKDSSGECRCKSLVVLSVRQYRQNTASILEADLLDNNNKLCPILVQIQSNIILGITLRQSLYHLFLLQALNE